jgi:hypothetical protein
MRWQSCGSIAPAKAVNHAENILALLIGGQRPPLNGLFPII